MLGSLDQRAGLHPAQVGLRPFRALRLRGPDGINGQGFGDRGVGVPPKRRCCTQPQAGDFGETGSFRCSEQVPQPVISFADLKIEPVELCITLVLKLSHRWWWIWFSRRRCRLSVAMGGSPW